MKNVEISNILHAYFRLKGHHYEPKQAAHREVWKMNVRYAEKIARMSGHQYGVAIQKIETVAEWARSKKLDWTLSTVVKRWLEDNQPEPKKPFYVVGKERYPARKVDGKWVALMEGVWKELNTQYLNMKEVIEYE